MLAAFRAQLTSHDVAGWSVATLQDGDLTAGEHPLAWSSAQAPGVYFARLETPTARVSRRFVVLER
jgi:hypothetical protein